MDNIFNVQVLFNPEDIQLKTVKTMDRAARLAIMPEYEVLQVMYCVDLMEGALVELCDQIL